MRPYLSPQPASSQKTNLPTQVCFSQAECRNDSAKPPPAGTGHGAFPWAVGWAMAPGCAVGLVAGALSSTVQGSCTFGNCCSRLLVCSCSTFRMLQPQNWLHRFEQWGYPKV